MLEAIRALLAANGIEKTAPVRLDDCRIVKNYLLEREGITAGTAVIFAVPYYTTECDDPARNISAYAVSADYHGFCRALFDQILPVLREKFPGYRFAGFTDHSPIDERDAAVKSGLGFIGKNHLFLTKEYSSYVFLGEIITDALLPVTPSPITGCLDCGACLAACPVGLDGWKCLSGLTQKKGTFSEEEAHTVLENGSLWGCDRCQEACPVTKSAKKNGTLYSGIAYFKTTAIPHLDRAVLDSMDESAFRARAYSWRGRAVIERNIALFEEKEENE